MIDRASEWPKIRQAALRYGIDPLFVMAVRLQEAGGAGREFGVLAVLARTYDEQLAACCATLRRYLTEYNRNPFVVEPTAAGLKRIAYSPAFIAEAGRRYCPIGAGNDPGGLNHNWIPGVESFYRAFAQRGFDPLGDWPEVLA